MYLNTGAFSQGQQEARDRFETSRARNAQLYAQFIQNNPDATTAQRDEFASTLSGGSNFLRSMLPSREVMEQNVARRQRELGAAAEQRRLSTLRTQLGLMNDASSLYANSYLAGGDAEAAMSSVTGLMGNTLPESILPAVAANGRRIAQENVDARMRPVYDAWTAAGAPEGDVSTWSNYGPEDLVSGWSSRAAAHRSRLAATQEQQAMSEVERVALTGDTAAFDAVTARLQGQFPALGSDAISRVTAHGQTSLDARVAEQARVEDARISGHIGTVAQLVNEGAAGYETAAAARAHLTSRVSQDPNIRRELTTEEMARIDQAVEGLLQAEILRRDVEERRAAGAALAQAELGRSAPVYENPQDRTTYEQAITEGVLSSIRDEDGAPLSGDEVKAVSSLLSSRIGTVSRSLGVSIKDRAAYETIFRAVAEKMAEEGSATPSEQAVAAAMHDYYMSDASYEGAAYRSSLAELGLASISELYVGGSEANLSSFNAQFTQERGNAIMAASNNYDPEVYRMQGDGGMISVIEDTVSNANTAVASHMGEGDTGLLAEVSALIGSEAPAADFGGQQPAMESRIFGAAQTILDQVSALEQRKLQASAMLSLPQFQGQSNAAARSSLMAQIDNINGTLDQYASSLQSLQQANEQLRAYGARAATKAAQGGDTSGVAANIPAVVSALTNGGSRTPSPNEIEQAAQELAGTAGMWASINASADQIAVARELQRVLEIQTGVRLPVEGEPRGWDQDRYQRIVEYIDVSRSGMGLGAADPNDYEAYYGQ